METKERILDEALTLFAKRGCGAVSVREIARAVGVRESSLYNHFANKQAIFDAIVDRCFQRAQAYFEENALPFAPGDGDAVFRGVGLEELQALVERIFRYFFEDPWNTRFRRLLVISQFEDHRCREIYRQLYRDYCLRFQACLFAGLMEAGELREEDPMALAVEFYSPIYLLLHTCDGLEEARPAMRAHVEQFTKNYWREKRA